MFIISKLKATGQFVLSAFVVIMAYVLLFKFWFGISAFCTFLDAFVEMVEIWEVLGLWNCTATHDEETGVVRTGT